MYKRIRRTRWAGPWEDRMISWEGRGEEGEEGRGGDDREGRGGEEGSPSTWGDDRATKDTDSTYFRLWVTVGHLSKHKQVPPYPPCCPGP